MANINIGRVIGGGLLAGVVMNIVDGIGNGAVLGARWQAEGNALSPTLMATPGLATTSMAGWMVVDLLLGILTVWVYAAVRPRFGAGPRTALVAASAVWLATTFFFASYGFNGFYSWGLIAATSVFALVGRLAGGLTGGWFYKE